MELSAHFFLMINLRKRCKFLGKIKKIKKKCPRGGFKCLKFFWSAEMKNEFNHKKEHNFLRLYHYTYVAFR